MTLKERPCRSGARLPGALLLACTGALILGFAAPGCGAPEAGADPAAQARCEEESSELFERRIAPILAADRPKSCNGCHLAGVDLSMFVRDTACGTVACLVEQGLVDPEDPERSIVLDWILRAQPDSALITEAVILEEHDAFQEWLVASLNCGDGACRRATCDDSRPEQSCELGQDPAPIDDASAHGCSEGELEALFRATVFEGRGRCFPCHHEGQEGAPPTAPRFFATAGTCDAASLATRRNVHAAGYLDVEAPEESLLLLKPLSESAGGTEHGGHAKFATTQDATYAAFLTYVERVGSCRD